MDRRRPLTTAARCKLGAVIIGAAALAGVVGSGCGVGGVVSPDATTDPLDAGGDGGDLSSGLRIEFRAAAGLPLDIGGPFDIQLDREASYTLLDVRALGDAAPGDWRTTSGAVDLDWRRPDAVEDPWTTSTIVSYPDAPLGIYSSVVFRLERYRFRGEVTFAGEDVKFDIQDEPDSTSIVVALPDVELTAGAPITLVVNVTAALAVESVDWATFADEEETIEIRKDDSEIDSVRASVTSSFAFFPGD